MAAVALTESSLPVDVIECRLARLRSAIQEAQRELNGLQNVIAEAIALAQGGLACDQANGQPTALTRQERRVAQLLARGRSNSEIAATLHVSLHTIKSQVHSILRKHGLRSRWQLMSRPSSQE